MKNFRPKNSYVTVIHASDIPIIEVRITTPKINTIVLDKASNNKYSYMWEKLEKSVLKNSMLYL